MKTQLIATPNNPALRALVSKVLPTLHWRYHGIGALQAYVSEDVRVHIWHDRLLLPGMRQSGGIHNHRFDLESAVLVGSLINREFDSCSEASTGLTAFELYEVRKAGGSAELIKIPGPISMSCIDVTIASGFTYRYPKGAFHESISHGTTITIVTKTHQEDVPPRVLSPLGVTPVNALAAEFDPRAIPAIVGEAEQLLRAAKMDQED